MRRWMRSKLAHIVLSFCIRIQFVNSNFRCFSLLVLSGITGHLVEQNEDVM